jgi:ATP-dependent RNA helicase RhlE
MTEFAQLNLASPLLRAVADEGYTRPTPIQARAIPHVLAGRDLLGVAQTGTGKTAAFALPILQNLDKHPPRGRGHRVLVLAPTRELASQIAERFTVYGAGTRSRATVIFGGVGQDKQVNELRHPAAVLVACPGRLLDLMNQGYVRLNDVEVLVLDEADRMLDMGFLPDVRRILAKVPTQRQTLLFSATMPAEIDQLSKTILEDPIKIEVTPAATTAEKVEQSVFMVAKNDKKKLIADLLRHDHRMTRVLVFTRTKHGANKVVDDLDKAGIVAEAIHGNKSQSARERALEGFKKGTVRVLVATDIAARGIDVDEISHVVNYDLPNVPETYVHRIGRTARAGASGIALSFCDGEEREFLRDIERLTRQPVRRVEGHPYQDPSTRGPLRGSPAQGDRAIDAAAAARTDTRPSQSPRSTDRSRRTRPYRGHRPLPGRQ